MGMVQIAIRAAFPRLRKTESFWFVDTFMSPAITPALSALNRPPAIPAPSQEESIRRAEIVTPPVIRPALSALSRPRTTLVPIKDKPNTPPAMLLPQKTHAMLDISLIDTCRIGAIIA